LEHSTAASAFLIASGPAASGSSSSSNSSSNVHSSGVPCDRISAWKEGIPSPCVHEGRAATFVGADDACFSVLSVDGRELSLYANDAPRSRMAHYTLDRSCDLVFRGPSPNAVAFSSIGDVATNKPGIFGLLHNAEGRGKCMRGWLPLKPGERVRRAFFQKIDSLAASSSSSDETHGKPTGAVAILTDQSRLVLAEWHGSGEKGEPCVMTALTETPVDRLVSSCAWVGPALLFTEANGSIGVLTWHDDDRTSDNVGHKSRSGSVLSLCGGGLGAGASDGGALLTFTEDAAILLHATGDSPPAPPASSSRPIAFMDALCVAWGSMCDSHTTRGLPAPVDAARRAVATAAGRYDASRVSERALDAIGRSLALPGLASNVGARATHLGVGARARAAARAYRASAAVESARLSQNQAADLTVPPERLAFATPASCEVAPDVAAAMRDAAEAAAFIGDARAAFDAAALAVGATGGKDVSALVRLCERGVAAADGSGGFAIIEAAVRQKLADGSAVKNACVEALARRRAPTLPPPDGIEQPAGFEVQLGSMAASASTSATGREAGVAAGMGKEVSRASTLTHSDWLGRRVRDTGNGAGGVEGDGSDPGVRSNRAGVGGGDGWGTSPPASNPTSPSRGPNPAGGVNFRPAAPVQPELQTRAQTATPPSFAPIAQQQQQQQQQQTSGFAAFPPANQTPGFTAAPGPTTPGSDLFQNPVHANGNVHSTNPGNLSVQLPAAGARPPGDNPFTNAASGGDVSDPFGDVSDPFANKGPVPPRSSAGGSSSVPLHPPPAAARAGFEGFDTHAYENASNTGTSPTALTSPTATTFANRAYEWGGSQYTGTVGEWRDESQFGGDDPFGSDDDSDEDDSDEDSDDPFGDPFGDVPGVGASSPPAGFGAVAGGPGSTLVSPPPTPPRSSFAPPPAAASPPPPPPPPPPSVTMTPIVMKTPALPARNRAEDDPPAIEAHLPTARAVSAGLRAFEASDYDPAEMAFKTATRRAAVETLAPVRGRGKIVRKCVAYAVACRILRHVRVVCEFLAVQIAENPGPNPGGVGSNSPWNDPNGHPHRRQATIEIARLTRHLAALPLDPTHVAAALR
jgi:hypothetical protein